MNHKSAFAIVINEEGQILLTQRKDVPIWVLPGGGIDKGETPEAAAIREVLEETGITTKVLNCSANYFPINNLAKETYLFTCQPLSGVPTLSNETSDVRYFPLSALPSALFLVHRIWIEDFVNSNGKKIERNLNEVSYSAFLRYIFCHPLIFLKFLWTRIKHG